MVSFVKNQKCQPAVDHLLSFLSSCFYQVLQTRYLNLKSFFLQNHNNKLLQRPSVGSPLPLEERSSSNMIFVVTQIHWRSLCHHCSQRTDRVVPLDCRRYLLFLPVFGQSDSFSFGPSLGSCP